MFYGQQAMTIFYMDKLVLYERCFTWTCVFMDRHLICKVIIHGQVCYVDKCYT